jgi:3-hydroxybutyryl-CoA dehydrogenase
MGTETPTAPIGVIGGGTMGRSIASHLVARGMRTIVVEASPERALAAFEGVRATLARSNERGQTDVELGSLGDLLEVGSAVTAIEEAALVIESVPEVIELKREVIASAQRVVGDGVPIGSNTSAIAIGVLQQGQRWPAAIGGLHFFNPVPASALVEVVVGPETAEETTVRLEAFARAIAKEPIRVMDAPGFATSRLGVALGLEAIRMLEEGVASAEDIDRAMVLGYKHPVGPLRLTDLVGLDVRLAIARYLEQALGERYSPPSLLVRMVEEGKLGRKSGEGFFRW